VAKHLQRDLDYLKREILTVGAVVQDSIDNAILAFIHRRSDIAQEVIAGDDRIDALEVEIEEVCLKMLALHHPVATDLRFIVATMKVNNDLERMGDLAVNIAQRALYLGEHEPIAIPTSLRIMAEGVRSMVRGCLDALVELDTDLARKVCLEDGPVDDALREMFQIMEGVMMEDQSCVRRAIQILSASRNLERIADLATNIAEDVVFMVEGEVVRHRGDAI
jgi:phosphate transport system protein